MIKARIALNSSLATAVAQAVAAHVFVGPILKLVNEASENWPLQN